MSSRLLERSSAWLDSHAEWLWATQFSLLSRATSGGCRRFVAEGGTRALVVAPHPDDEAIGCAGTMMLHRRAGDRVAIAHVTDGRASHALGLGTDEMVRRRHDEAVAGAAVLGVDRVEWIGLHEGSWSMAEAVPALAAIVRQFDPDVVYAPSRIDHHFEHFRVAHALAAVLGAAEENGRRRPRIVRIYQVHVPLTPALCNLVADVESFGATIAAALGAYVTQRANMRRSMRLRRYTGALQGIPGRAEGFWEIAAERYSMLHCDPPQGWPLRTFRGLRPRPFSDGLAFAQGTGERRRLAKLLRSATGGGTQG